MTFREKIARTLGTTELYVLIAMLPDGLVRSAATATLEEIDRATAADGTLPARLALGPLTMSWSPVTVPEARESLLEFVAGVLGVYPEEEA